MPLATATGMTRNVPKHRSLINPLFINLLNLLNTMNENKKNIWSIVLKVIIAVATAIAGAVGLSACI